MATNIGTCERRFMYETMRETETVIINKGQKGRYLYIICLKILVSGFSLKNCSSSIVEKFGKFYFIILSRIINIKDSPADA